MKPDTLGAALQEREQTAKSYTVPRACAAEHVAAFILHKDLVSIVVRPLGLADCRIVVTLWK
jgi:hypothetical protein